MLQSLKYEFLRIIRAKDMMFWSVALPVLLGTFMYMAFSGIGEFEGFEAIPVAIVIEDENAALADNFNQMIDTLASEEVAILAPTHTDSQEAVGLLDEDEVVGIYFLRDNEVSLKVANSGINQSVLMTITDRFIQVQNTMETIADEGVELIPGAVADITRELNINRESQIGRGALDFFEYNIMIFLVLTVFMGANQGLKLSMEFQANRSPLAARRFVSPTKKMKTLITQLTACVIMQTIYGAVALTYFIFALGLDFGVQIPLVILAIMVGSTTAVSMGMALGSVVKKGDILGLEGILTGVIVVMCALAGMMGTQFRIMVRSGAPIVDRINPATMLADALYSLSSFDDYRIFITGLGGLAITTVLFLSVSTIILRRKSYDSI
jgi:ABC-2 type transport system permease protein